MRTSAVSGLKSGQKEGVHRFWSTAALSAVAVVLCCAVPDVAIAEEIAVVTHQEAKIDSVGKADLSRFFLAVKSELGGVRYKAVNLADKGLKDSFLTRLTGLDVAGVADHFVQAELRGEGKWPPEVPGSTELVRLIVGSKNVVGWLPKADLDGLPERQRSVLKVVAVDGKKPGESGYAFGP